MRRRLTPGASGQRLHTYFLRLRVRGKPPALTLAQAKTLLAAVLREPDRLRLTRALAIVRYRQERNYAASRSHAARTAARHKRRRRRKPQVSL